MIYTLAYDWVAIFAQTTLPLTDQGSWTWEKEPFGTRQFYDLHHVKYNGKLFADVQSRPCSQLLPEDALIFKVHNSWLYDENWYDVMTEFIDAYALYRPRISRLDIAADFNKFHNGLHPMSLIRRVMRDEVRKVGKAQGQCYFESVGKWDSHSYNLGYNAIRYGKHGSDCAVYLYCKSLELADEKNKPWIRRFWRKYGLHDVEPPIPGSKSEEINSTRQRMLTEGVWRLEVSLKSAALHLVQKGTGEKYDFTYDKMWRLDEAIKLFHMYVYALFRFKVPSATDSNASRWKDVQLFDESPSMERGSVKHAQQTSSNDLRFIRTLYNIQSKYPDLPNSAATFGRKLARAIAQETDIEDWFDMATKVWS